MITPVSSDVTPLGVIRSAPNSTNALDAKDKAVQDKTSKSDKVKGAAADDNNADNNPLKPNKPTTEKPKPRTDTVTLSAKALRQQLQSVQAKIDAVSTDAQLCSQTRNTKLTPLYAQVDAIKASLVQSTIASEPG